MCSCPIGQCVKQSKNRRYEMLYVVTGGIPHTGSERIPKGICTDRIVGTRKAGKLTKG
jgi:hypothetical protein